MAFLPNIPQPNDTLSVSQGNLLNNFQLLGAIAGNTNAASASINATSGFNWLFLPVQAGSPPAAASFPAGQIGLYSFLNASTTQNELYINKTTNLGLLQIPMTAGVMNAGGDSWAYLPSGALLKWGGRPAAATVTVTMAGPAITNILTVLVTALDANASPLPAFKVGLKSTNAGANQFTAYCIGSGANTFIQYLAICQP